MKTLFIITLFTLNLLIVNAQRESPEIEILAIKLIEKLNHRTDAALDVSRITIKENTITLPCILPGYYNFTLLKLHAETIINSDENMSIDIHNWKDNSLFDSRNEEINYKVNFIKTNLESNNSMIIMYYELEYEKYYIIAYNLY